LHKLDSKTTYTKNGNKFYFVLIFFSLLFVLTKYFISYLNFPNEYLFSKIIKFSDTEYFNIVESFSRLDFYTDWNKFEIAKKIIGFPIFSILVHSFFFKFLSYYSFLLLEVVFFFLIILLLFLIFKECDFNNLIPLIGILVLLIILQSINYINPDTTGLLHKLRLPIQEFIGVRFPRPLLTSVYTLIILYNLLRIINKKNLSKKKNFYTISIFLVFLLNSFFYLFITLFLLTLLYFSKLLFETKQIKFRKQVKFVIINFLIIFFGFIIFFYQQYLSELDYANRIGLYKINIQEKFFLLEIFSKKLLQLEIILIILLSLFFRVYNSKKKVNDNYNLFFNFFCLSLASPFIFIILTDKVISLYHFWTVAKFSGFFYIYLSLLNMFNLIVKKNYLNIKKILFLSFTIFQILNILISLTYNNSNNNQSISDGKQVMDYLKKNYNKTNHTLLGPQEVIFYWLHLQNKFFLTPSGFETSLSDNQLENIIFLQLKIFKINDEVFFRILNDKSCGRECFAKRFNYKYSVNSLRHYKPINYQYSSTDLLKILNESPLVAWNTIMPMSEKKRLINKYRNFKFNPNKLPEIIILEKSSEFFNSVEIFDYHYLALSNNSYKIFLRR
jgi:hypothetical protein